ncbi:hypothetical protein I4U23_026850 [Adineta vaga]|nr:hypothetical protein I4U23_026850 [Adineta vaga]
MMEAAVKQQNDSNAQTMVTAAERQALLQKLVTRWPAEISKQVESQAYEKSHGIKLDYFKLIQVYFQKVQTIVQNRASQQQQNNNGSLQNGQINLNQPTSVPMVTQIQQPSAPMVNQIQQTPFPVAQQSTRMIAAQTRPQYQLPRLREPTQFNPTPTNTFTYSQSPTSTTTIDLSQGYSSQPMNIPNPNDNSTLQSRYPIPSAGNIPRQRAIIPNNNFQPQPSVNNSNDILHQFLARNSSSSSSSASSIAAVAPATTNDNSNILHRILQSNTDGGTNKPTTLTRQSTGPLMSQSARSGNPMNSSMTNSTNSLRSTLSSQQLSPSPSVVIMPTSTQTSTVQIQPSSNITIQQSPLSNSNGPFSANSQTVSTNSSTPILGSYSSPANRSLSLTGTGSISSPDDETLNLIKYLKENVHRLQLYSQKFTNEGNNEKVRQVQSIYQQILQFINNPTHESLTIAKQYRDMLDRIPNRSQQVAPSNVQTNVFNQCIKATHEFLARSQKDRMNLTKRYLEPLNDVINGVPHKMMRLDDDSYSMAKIRASHHSSLLSKLNDELNQLPNNIYSIECMPISRTRKILDSDEEYLSKDSVVLRCKLLEKSHPMIPLLRLHVTTSYPEQSPEILSLTKTMPPRLEFTDDHPFFDQISSMFISHLFKLRPQHTVTDILNIWRLSVQTAL